MAHKLTKTYVESLPATTRAGQQQLIYDSSLKGFGLRIGSKTKTYFAETKIARKTVRVTLGRHGVITSEEARKLAKEKLAAMAQNVNPNEVEKEARIRGVTLQQIYLDYLKARDLKASTRRDYERCVRLYLSDWLNKAMLEINRDMVERRHQKISERSKAQANLTMRFLRALFNFAAEYRDAKGRSLITDNPVRRLSAKKIWNRVSLRTNHLQPHQIKPWWEAVHSLRNDAKTQDRETIRDYLTLLLLTGLRREEALGLTWANVDFAANTLTVRDTKNRSDHTLPLSDYLQDLLARRHAQATDVPWVFNGSGRTGHLTEPRKALLCIKEQCGIWVTSHDLRRSFASIVNRLSDRMSYYTVKRLLNHKSADVTAGYIQHDIEKLREAIQAVTDYVLQQAGVEKRTAVVAFRR